MTEALSPYHADFRNFVHLIWAHLGLPSPTDVQYDIAKVLQKGPKRMIVQAFRGVGKSWLTAALVCWLLLNDPQCKIMVVSASKQKADEFSTFVKRLIAEVPILAHLKSRGDQRDSMVSFDVGPANPDISPSVKSVGITGQLTGSRADIIIADDIEVPNNSLTQMMRDRLAEMVKEFDAVLKPLGTSRIIYLGTPQTEMTLYTKVEGRGYRTFIWPARYPSPSELRYTDRMAKLLHDRIAKDQALIGKPTDPARFPEKELQEREASYGRSGFRMQFMLDPSASDADRFPLKLSDLMVLDLNAKLGPVQLTWASSPDLRVKDVEVVGLEGDALYRPMFVSREAYVPYQGILMAIDPSGRGGDELGYAIVAQLNGMLYLLDCKGLKGGYSDANLQALADKAKQFGVTKVVVESNFGDGMFSKLLTPFMVKTHPASMEEKHSVGQKEKRIIDVLEPIMNQHRLVVDRRLLIDDQQNYNGYAEDHAPRYQLFYQMTRLTKDKGSLAKDDRIDALSIAVAAWVEIMDQDTRKAETSRKEELFNKELEDFMRVAGGQVQSENTLSEFFPT